MLAVDILNVEVSAAIYKRIIMAYIVNFLALGHSPILDPVSGLDGPSTVTSLQEAQPPQLARVGGRYWVRRSRSFKVTGISTNRKPVYATFD